MSVLSNTIQYINKLTSQQLSQTASFSTSTPLDYGGIGFSIGNRVSFNEMDSAYDAESSLSTAIDMISDSGSSITYVVKRNNQTIPNPEVDYYLRADYLRSMFNDLVLYGNIILILRGRTESGIFKQILPQNTRYEAPSTIRIQSTNTDYDGSYNIQGESGTNEIYGKGDDKLIHIKARTSFNFYGGLYGKPKTISIMPYVRKIITASQINSAKMQNSIIPSGIFTIDGSLGNETKSQIANEIRKMNQKESVGKVLITETRNNQGISNIAYSPFDINTAQEYREQTDDAKNSIYTRFGIPLSLIKQEVTYENQEAAKLAFIQSAVMPYSNIVSKGLTRLFRGINLISMSDEIVADLLQHPGYEEKKLQITKMRSEIGVTTINEDREFLGLPTSPLYDRIKGDMAGAVASVYEDNDNETN